MKKFKEIVLIFVLIFIIPSFAQGIDSNISETDKIFIPTQQIKDVMKYKNTNVNLLMAKPNKALIKDFVVAHERFAQSNVSVSYNEYEKLTQKVSNDFLRIVLAYELSEKGYFTLAKNNFEAIKNKYTFNDTIQFIKQMYFPKKILLKDDELKLATYYTDIYYNNLPFESAKNLSKDHELLKKSDYSYFVLAKAYLEAKEPAKALSNINKAISINKDNLNYKKYKAQILTEEKKYDEAVKIMEELIILSAPSTIAKEQNTTLQNYILAQSNSDKALSKYYLAKYLFSIGDNKRAIKEVNASISARKNNIEAYNLLGEIYLSENNLFKASESYQKAQKIKKNNPNTIIGLANIEFQWDDYDKAIELYTNALKKQKNNEDAMLNLAISYIMKDDINSSKNILTKILTLNPYNYKAYFVMSFLDKNKESENLKKAIAINPLFLEAWGNIAKCEFKKGNKIEGTNYLFPLEYLSYKNFTYYYCLGLIHKAEGLNIEAQKDFEQALNLYSTYVPAQEEYKKLNNDIIQKDNTEQ